MPKIIKCVVDTCYNFNTVNINNNENSSESISFFRFPKNPELKKQWLKILNKTKAKCTQRICSSHFEQKIIGLRGICKCLNENAVPTIFASASTATDHREPLVELDPNVLNLAEVNEENLNEKKPADDKLSSYGSSTEIPDSDQGECAEATKHIMSSGSKFDEESFIVEDLNKAYVRDRKRHKQLKRLKNLTLKRALKTSTSCENSSPTKTKCRKLKLKILRSSYLKMKQHRLDQKIIRQNRKIENLGNVLKDARNQNLLQEENLVNLLSMSESIKEILRRQLRKFKGLALPKVCPAKIRTFAMNLNFYSPKGYEYVRKTFDLLLPHSKTISEWYKCVNGKAGFTEESFIHCGYICKQR